MNSFASPTPSNLLTPLAERCPLPAADAAHVFETLLAQVAALHDQGRLHRELTADHVRLDGSLGVRPAASDEIVALGEGTELAEVCPPELQGPHGWVVPTEIERARAAFAAAGVACDPRRIDVYQLGALLCRMLTGQGVTAYLQSPRARGQVPASLRPLLDGALGYDAAKRIANCEQLRAAFQSATAAGTDDPQKTSQFSDTPFGSSIGREQNTPISAPAATGPHQAADDIKQLGPFQIVSRIGGGGMGDVYKAYEAALDRHVAIKVLPAALARHEDFVRRFRAEATAVAKLVHPNIVQIHAIGEDAGHHYFAMQFVDGESLAELLRRRKRLPLGEALSIIEQCLHGLAAAHHQQLIHRDVKPGNILLDRATQRALLADFGLVKKIQAGSTLTATGVIMGTVDYIPPEQARGLPVDGRADLYSLGVLMYQMLSGRLPFTADTPTGMIFQHAYEPPTPLVEVAPDVPSPIAAMIARLMAKNPDDRYQTAADVLADIAAYRSGKPIADATASGDSISPDYDAITDTFAPVGGWRTRLLNQFRRHAPEIAGKLENTVQQVDGAVFQYEQRRNRLAQLVHDADEATAALAAQEASHRQAAEKAAEAAAAATDPAVAARLRQEQAELEKTAADFARQFAEQQSQNEQLRSQLAEVDGRLVSLRNQRDLLRARLRTAQAQIQIEGSTRKSHAWKTAAIVLGISAVAIAVWWFGGGFFAGRDVSSVENKASGVAANEAGAKLPDGAVLVFTFDEGTFYQRDGNTYVKDLSGNGNDGLVSGTRPIPGQAGEALSFARDDDYVECENSESLDFTRNMTVSAWIRVNSWDRDNHVLGNVNEDTSGASGYTIKVPHGEALFTVGSGPRWLDTRSMKLLELGKWYHVAATQDGGKVVVYVNGEDSGSADYDSISPSNTKLRIGQTVLRPDKRFDGDVDEVAIFSRALTRREIRSIYEMGLRGTSLAKVAPPAQTAASKVIATIPAMRGAIAYWRFEDGKVGEYVGVAPEPQFIKDVSGNGNELKAHEEATAPRFSDNVPADTIPLTGEPNRGSLEFTELPGPNYKSRDVYVVHRGPGIDLNAHVFGQWTVEVSGMLATLDEHQDFVSCDGANIPGDDDPRYHPFEIGLHHGRFQLMAHRQTGERVEAVSAIDPHAHRWYHFAGTCDGQTMKFYIDSGDGRGYALQDSKPFVGPMYNSGYCWVLGRGQWDNTIASQLHGWVDEARISDVARDPSEFLFAPNAARSHKNVGNPPQPRVEVDLLKLVDLKRDAVNGEWELRDGALVSDSGVRSRIGFPYQAPEEYDFQIVFTRLSGNSLVGQVCTAAHDRQFIWNMGPAGGSSGFDQINGVGPYANGSKRTFKIVNGRTYTSVVKVRRDRIQAFVDGKLISDWKTDYKDMTLWSEYGLHASESLGVVTWESPTIFHSVKVIEISGSGKVLNAEDNGRERQSVVADAAKEREKETVDVGPVDQPVPADDELLGTLEKLLEQVQKPDEETGIQKVGPTVVVKGAVKDAKEVRVMFTRLSNPNWRGIWHLQAQPVKRDGDKFETDCNLIDENGTPSQGAGQFFAVIAVARETKPLGGYANVIGLPGSLKAVSKLIVVKRDR